MVHVVDLAILHDGSLERQLRARGSAYRKGGKERRRRRRRRSRRKRKRKRREKVRAGGGGRKGEQKR